MSGGGEEKLQERLAKLSGGGVALVRIIAIASFLTELRTLTGSPPH